jgi:hypothetical protein
MAKTQMQLANKAWRNLTKRYGWQRAFQTKRAWRAFCRENAGATLESQNEGMTEPFKNYADAEWQVMEEMSYWD